MWFHAKQDQSYSNPAMAELGPGGLGFAISIKGQIKSEWISEIINSPKNDPKNLKDFCPMYYKNSQGRNPSNFLVI